MQAHVCDFGFTIWLANPTLLSLSMATQMVLLWSLIQFFPGQRQLISLIVHAQTLVFKMSAWSGNVPSIPSSDSCESVVLTQHCWLQVSSWRCHCFIISFWGNFVCALVFCMRLFRQTFFVSTVQKCFCKWVTSVYKTCRCSFQMDLTLSTHAGHSGKTSCMCVALCPLSNSFILLLFLLTAGVRLGACIQHEANKNVQARFTRQGCQGTETFLNF